MNKFERTAHLPVPSPRRYKAASRIGFSPYLNRRGIEVSGLENLPEGNAPYILAINHRSMLDAPLIGQVLLEHDGTQVHFVTKKELVDIPLVGNYIKKSGGIRFDRDMKMSQQPAVIEAMNFVIQHNGVLGMFPEHTRRTGPKVMIEKRGLGMLAVGNYAPIATAGIYGTESMRGQLYVNFGKTIYTGPMSAENRRSRMVEMEAEYTASLQEAVDTAYIQAGAQDVMAQAQEGGL